MGKGLELDFETADRITLLNLQDNLRYLEEEVRLHVEEGQYLHPEDHYNSTVKLIPSLKILIAFYGGTV
jgi:hypothetical protein